MLYLEPRFILNEEVSDTTTYFSILEVIAKGEHNREILQESLSTGNTTYVLSEETY